MLSSEATITFPALLLFDGDMYYSEVLTLEDLTHHRGTREPLLRDHEIVDSAGQRFFIRGVANRQQIVGEPHRSPWKRLYHRLFPGEPHFRLDLELEPLPSETFAETHRRVMEKEWAQEAFHLMEGGAPDTAERRERLEQCRSIAEIIAFSDPNYPSQPAAAADEAYSPSRPNTVLASEAPIVFPALLFRAGDGYYDAVPGPQNLRYARSGQMSNFLGDELVDSAGQRFRLFRFVDMEERVELRQKTAWYDVWDDGVVYGFDLELEPLPSIAFEDVHQRILAMERALDATPYRRWKYARSPDAKQRLERCRSVAEVIATLGLEDAGAPPALPS